MIKINNQYDMIQVAELYLHQHKNYSQSDIFDMDEFEKYYQARELVKIWNEQPNQILNNIILSLEINGINYSIFN